MRAAALALAAALCAGCAAAGGPPVAREPAPVGAVVVLGAPPAGEGRYLGSEACRGCHPEAYARWRATRHAAPYAGLAAADRGNPACLRCHVTAFADPAGGAAGAEALAAVGCEACHGPGADHAGSRHPGLVATATGGECPPCEANRICRRCHTPARSPGFELGPALARVACAP